MRYRTAHDIPALYREECNFYDHDAWRAGRGTNVARAAIDPSCTARPASALQVVFLWGDSHAEHLSPGLRATLPSDVAVLQVASFGCPAALVPADDRNPNWCRTSNREAVAAIRRVRPDVVVVAQRGAHRIDRLRTIATALHDAGVPRVVVVGPIPQWTPVLPKVVARDEWPRPPHRSKDHLDPDIVADERALAGSMRPDEPFAYVDLFAALCDDRGCLVDVDGDRDEGLVTFDYGT